MKEKFISFTIKLIQFGFSYQKHFSIYRIDICNEVKVWQSNMKPGNQSVKYDMKQLDTNRLCQRNSNKSLIFVIHHYYENTVSKLINASQGKISPQKS